GHHPPTSGEHTEDKAEDAAATDRSSRFPQLRPAGESPSDLPGDDRLALLALEAVEDLADPEQAHGDRREIEAAEEIHVVEREPRHPLHGVLPDRGEQQAQCGDTE